jgi:alpha-beta hydrolase superfamily lysophospholipase
MESLTGSQKIFYESADGVGTIHARIWQPAEGVTKKGIIQIVHGMSEHILRYREFAEFMTARGFVVCGNDHLGHGKSANGNFGHFGENGHKLLAKDVHKLTALVKQEFDAPVILLGIGAGSLIARYINAIWNMEFHGAAYSGTSAGGGGLHFLHKVLGGMRSSSSMQAKEAARVDKLVQKRFNRSFRNSEHGPSWLSRDADQIAAYNADPLCGFALTYGAWLDLLKLSRIVNSKTWPMRIEPTMPIFLFSGLNDPMGGQGRGVIKVYGDLLNAGHENVDITLYQDARHEMLFELNRQEVYGDFAHWAEVILETRN